MSLEYETNCTEANRYLFEVYPHAALVELLELEKTIKYKKGLVADRRKAFRCLQKKLDLFLSSFAPWVLKMPETKALFQATWSKGTEDQFDSVICALIAWWHHHHAGEKSLCLGDKETGEMVVPFLKDQPRCFQAASDQNTGTD